MGSRASMGSRQGRSALNESRDSNMSFLSKSFDAGRNRFFTPKQVYDLPPEDEKNEAWYIKQFYKEFCSIVK